MNFTEENIQLLFGHEAAEDEDINRLRQYYFKGTVYDQIMADAPLRILVGHKGIGKSALFQVAIAEDQENGYLVVKIQPNDVVEIATDETDLLRLIGKWTEGLQSLITNKAIHVFGILDDAMDERLDDADGEIITALIESIGDPNVKIKDSKLDLVQNFLDNSRIAVYIDDLDRGWQGRRYDVTRISALLNAIRDISRKNKGIKFRVALRSDVYYLVRTSDESTDKIDGSVIWHTWTNHEIFVLLIKRIETFFGRNINEQELVARKPRELAQYLDPIMESRFTGKGHWSNAPIHRVLMSLIRKRPRDLVKLCTLAARHAHTSGNTIIRTSDFEASFQRYSQDRIQDTINEYKTELPNIERLIMNMRPYKKEREAKLGFVYSTTDLLEKIGKILESHPLEFADKQRISNKQNIAAFLYKINFLTARKETPSGIVRSYFEENRYLASSFVDFGFQWEVHPAYRWALQPESIDEIFLSLELSQDEE